MFYYIDTVFYKIVACCKNKSGNPGVFGLRLLRSVKSRGLSKIPDFERGHLWFFIVVVYKEGILDQTVVSGGIKVSGSLELLNRFFSYFDEFEFWFNLVTP